MANDLSHLFQLPTAEKLRLVEDLWDNIASSGDALPVPQWQIDELRRRKELRSAGAPTSTWEDVQRRIRERESNG